MSEHCKKECENCSDQEKCIPYFDHQNTMMHYNWANRRMLIALLSVCITFVLTILVFVFGYTVREKNWLNTLKELQTPVVSEVSDGQKTD